MPRFSFKRDHEKFLKSSVVSQFLRLCSHPRGRPVVRQWLLTAPAACSSPKPTSGWGHNKTHQRPFLSHWGACEVERPLASLRRPCDSRVRHVLRIGADPHAVGVQRIPAAKVMQ